MKVAIIATNGYEFSELDSPLKYLQDLDYTVDIFSPESGTISAAHDAGEHAVDYPLEDLDMNNYDALVLPGGVANPDQLRMNEDAVEAVQTANVQGKVIAAICHAPWLLAEADIVRGRTLTSWPSLQTDMINAGAAWVDETVVVSGNIITSRKPEDLDDFNAEVSNALREYASN